MPKLKLVYFDFSGGRGEAARLALSIGGIPFQDDRIAGDDWPKRKPGILFGALPVLEVDGQELAQSNSINRYVGRLANLYPSDPWQAARCDEAMDVVEELNGRIAPTLFLPEDQKKAQREALAAGPIPQFLSGLQKRLEAQGGQYFADNRLTVADLKVFLVVRWLTSGALDHIPTDLTKKVAPRLIEHHDRVANHPGVKAYYQQRAGAA
jgi:prostaglandin-H2 D-isomerase / glutathione transferase